MTSTLSKKRFSEMKPALHPKLLTILAEVEKFEFMTTVQVR